MKDFIKIKFIVPTEVIKLLMLFLLAAGILSSCEEEVNYALPAGEDLIIVEGRIEEGYPPFVVLTRNSPFYGNTNFSEADSFFVSNAEIFVSDGERTSQLFEYQIDSLSVNAKLYSVSLEEYLSGESIIGEAGKHYSLNINAEGKNLSSTTYIPRSIPMDSIWFRRDTIGEVDSLARVFVTMTDPDSIGNFYRYFSQVDQLPMWPGYNSVFDDRIINGKVFPTPIDKGVNRFEEIDFELFGYFSLGDSVTVRLSAIDERTYDYWNTLEANNSNAGPFAGITVIDDNIEGQGGFGIWGGYGVQEISIIIPED